MFVVKQVLHIITGLDDGGAESVLYRLCTHHHSAKHHVVSLTGDGKYGRLLRDADVQVTSLNMPGGRVTFQGLWRLWRLLIVERPQVVQTWMYHADLVGGVLARVAGIKNVFWNIRHTTLDRTLSKRSTIVVAKSCGYLSRWIPKGIVCCAEEAKEVHSELGYAKYKMQVIANGYDLRRFAVNEESRARLRREWGVGERWLLGMVGRFDPQKDHGNLFSAFGELKARGVDFYAVLIGRGLENDNCQIVEMVKAAGLGENLRLLGQRTDIPDIMNALDVHVLSSAFGEAFPNVVAEAMACGTPVVVTDVGDAALIVGETGWVVRPGDYIALADALIDARNAMRSSTEWKIRSFAARQRVEENFGLARMVRSYDRLWRGLLH